MKKELLLYALLAAAIVLLSATAVAAFERDDVLRRVRYDVSAEREFEGSVVDTPRVFEGFMHFTLRTEDALVVVQIGPKDFVQRSKFKLETGQMLFLGAFQALAISLFVLKYRVPQADSRRETLLVGSFSARPHSCWTRRRGPARWPSRAG